MSNPLIPAYRHATSPDTPIGSHSRSEQSVRLKQAEKALETAKRLRDEGTTCTDDLLSRIRALNYGFALAKEQNHFQELIEAAFREGDR